MYDKDLLVIKEILMEILEVDESQYSKYEITRDTYLVNKTGKEQINLSSLDYVRFITEVENRFNVFYNFEGNLNTVGDIMNYISKYKKWRKIDEQ